jgi:thiamine pyrophosphate-dependent acetolactate synthase large subunit-like protein
VRSRITAHAACLAITLRDILRSDTANRHRPAGIGEAFGAYGEKVTNPDDVPAALKRCVDSIRGGRTAILHVRVTKL